MATDGQIQANRRNAARSTGPKTKEGKAKARLNALKRGGRARTTDVMPVLPHEDPRELEEQIDRLEQMVAELEEIPEAEAAEAARAAFDPRPAFERHRRRQAFLDRELLRTVDTLRRLRKVDVGPSVDDGQGELTGASASPPATQPASKVELATDREVHEHENSTNEAIYERGVVKRGGADFVSQGSRTSPSPSASVDLAHLRPVRGRVRSCTLQHIL